MKLTEIESPTELISKAIEDGIVTVEEYGMWIVGYSSGARDARNDAFKVLREIAEPEPDYSSIKEDYDNREEV